jgi:hypothetical protein
VLEDAVNRGQYPGMTFEQLRLGLESGMESGASGLTHTWSTLSCNASNNTGEATRKAVLGLIIKPLVGVGDSLYAERSELSERKLVVVLRWRAKFVRTNRLATQVLGAQGRGRRPARRRAAPGPEGRAREEVRQTHIPPPPLPSPNLYICRRYSEAESRALEVVSCGGSVKDDFVALFTLRKSAVLIADSCFWLLSDGGGTAWCALWEECSHYDIAPDGDALLLFSYGGGEGGGLAKTKVKGGWGCGLAEVLDRFHLRMGNCAHGGGERVSLQVRRASEASAKNRRERQQQPTLALPLPRRSCSSVARASRSRAVGGRPPSPPLRPVKSLSCSAAQGAWERGRALAQTNPLFARFARALAYSSGWPGCTRSG